MTRARWRRPVCRKPNLPRTPNATDPSPVIAAKKGTDEYSTPSEPRETQPSPTAAPRDGHKPTTPRSAELCLSPSLFRVYVAQATQIDLLHPQRRVTCHQQLHNLSPLRFFSFAAFSNQLFDARREISSDRFVLNRHQRDQK